MGAAEQQQFTQYPHRYGDGTLGAAIAQTRDGKDELVTPVALWELDDTSGLYLPPGLSQNPRRPRVDAQLSGRNVQPDMVEITATPLAAGGSLTAPLLHLTTAPGVDLISYVVAADTETRLTLSFGDGVEAPDRFRPKAEVVVFPRDAVGRPQIVPPFRPYGRTMSLRVDNPTGTDQTVLRVYELRYRGISTFPQNVRAVMARNLAIRDTSTHSRSSDPQFVWRLVRTALGGGKCPVFVDNQLDQAVTVDVLLSISDVMSGSLGTLEVPAASRRVITNQDFAGLDVPFEEIALTFKCSVAPTSGVLHAYCDVLVGGSA